MTSLVYSASQVTLGAKAPCADHQSRLTISMLGRHSSIGAHCDGPDGWCLGVTTEQSCASRARRSLRSPWSLAVPDFGRGGSEAAVHDVQADVAVRRVVEALGNRGEYLEAERMPQGYGRDVGLHDRVEHHGPEPGSPSPVQHVLA